MQHLMIDLETMGSGRVNIPVISIGAVFFEPNTGELGKTFYAAIDIADAFKYGVPSGDTVKWWMQQSDAARAAAVAGKHALPFALERFEEFVESVCPKQNVKPWGNGATFDISILEYAWPRALGRSAPWSFWNVRDCRTIKDVAELTGIQTGVVAGTAHNAKDDAIHQAKWVSRMWQALRKPATEDSMIG